LPRGRHQIIRPNRLTRSATGSTIMLAALSAGLTTTWWPGHATAGQAPPASIGQPDAELASAAQQESTPALVTFTKARAAQEEAARARRMAAQRAARRAAVRRAARLAAARAAEARQQAASQAASDASHQSAPPPASAPAPSGSPQQIAEAMLGSYGWSSSQFSCLDSLWNAESGWSVTASNPSSGAYGIPQALPGSKMASAGPDWQTSATTQIRWGLGYIKSLYGSPCGAWEHEESAGWY
jgi:hypothetical protein